MNLVKVKKGEGKVVLVLN